MNIHQYLVVGQLSAHNAITSGMF